MYVIQQRNILQGITGSAYQLPGYLKGVIPRLKAELSDARRIKLVNPEAVLGWCVPV